MFLFQPVHANESFLTPKTMVKIHFPLYVTTAGTQLRDYIFQQLHLHTVLGVWHLPPCSRSALVGSFLTAYHLYAAVAIYLWTRWRQQPFLECELLP